MNEKKMAIEARKAYEKQFLKVYNCYEDGFVHESFFKESGESNSMEYYAEKYNTTVELMKELSYVDIIDFITNEKNQS